MSETSPDSMLEAHEERIQRLESASAEMASKAALCGSHEERIQRLEAGFADLKDSVGELNATMQGFSEHLRMMSDNVIEKLEDVSHRLSDKLGNVAEVNKAIAQDSKAQAAELRTQAERLTAHLAAEEEKKKNSEEVSKKNSGRKELWNRILLAIFAASLGVGGTLLTAWIRGH